MQREPKIVIIGAGIGGLSAAALLLKAGYPVTILENHRHPGGCAASFRRKGYRFDAGATLLGGFDATGPHTLLGDELNIKWPTKPADPAWSVHLPAKTIVQWNDMERWRNERQKHFSGSDYEKFWERQEKLSALSWELATRNLPWPPQSGRELKELLFSVNSEMFALLPFLGRKVSDLIEKPRPDFLNFLDLQLLISAQTSAARCHALYGCAALDLPRRGVRHGLGGTGALAQTLADWICEHGGKIFYGQKVKKIISRRKKALAVVSENGLHLGTDYIIANLTPHALLKLTGSRTPFRYRQEVMSKQPFWSAYMLYLGVDENSLPPLIGSHHQVMADDRKPLGEGNSIFISLSEKGDDLRAPSGCRAVTISTHTNAATWFDLKERDPAAFRARRHLYREKIFETAEKALPGFRRAVIFDFDATPLTFARYTGRERVGGFPQESLFRTRGPAMWLENLWLTGDSIFPGQSTAAVTLGARRCVKGLIKSLKKS